MASMIDLCDLIAQNPSQFADKVAWICGRCPPINSVLPPLDVFLNAQFRRHEAVIGSPRVFLCRFRILWPNLFGRSRLEKIQSLRTIS
ncbi:unnamed protein product [Ilex paraguariensis]|uniref:Uncharacterized protein n=1 Tax=Ilex paraguariensis TaxID=185542 RepID=A0ABC8RPU5_9AQUA